MSLTFDISRLLVRELEACAREVLSYPDDESLWQTAPGVTNSTGNLALHLCGNLRHFVGASLGQTGYVRDRQLEFSTREGTRADVASELRATSRTVSETLARLNDDALDQRMPEAPNGMVTTTRMFLLHLVAHTAFHLGQAGYLRRTLQGTGAASAGPLPMDVLSEP